MALVPWTVEQQQAFVRSQFAAQQDHYAKTYPAASHDIIVADNRPVGHLYVGRLDHEIRIVDITLLPAERNAGIGSYLIKQLQDEAKDSGKVTRIFVEEFNPSLRLFERLGFTKRAARISSADAVQPQSRHHALALSSPKKRTDELWVDIRNYEWRRLITAS